MNALAPGLRRPAGHAAEIQIVDLCFSSDDDKADVTLHATRKRAYAIHPETNAHRRGPRESTNKAMESIVVDVEPQSRSTKAREHVNLAGPVNQISPAREAPRATEISMRAKLPHIYNPIVVDDLDINDIALTDHLLEGFASTVKERQQSITTPVLKAKAEASQNVVDLASAPSPKLETEEECVRSVQAILPDIELKYVRQLYRTVMTSSESLVAYILDHEPYPRHEKAQVQLKRKRSLSEEEVAEITWNSADRIVDVVRTRATVYVTRRVPVHTKL